MTGTRDGMSEKAKKTLRKYMDENQEITEVHHGDCVGSDEDFHHELSNTSINIFVHPPIKEDYRAFCKGHTVLPPKDYLIRNRDIVNICDVLVGFPRSEQEEVRSGTWSTIRYARKVGKKIILIFPNGNIKDEQ